MMSHSTDQTKAPGELSKTYFLHGQDDRARIQTQDRMATTGMGGVLPEQPDPAGFSQILDIGCGTGGWLMEMAKTYPNMQQLVGVDISERMIEYAQAQSEAQQLSHRVQFRQMNALHQLDFPEASFDLVNQRFAVGYLRTSDWPNQIQAYRRLARAGGVIRVTEGEPETENSSPALTTLSRLLVQALFQAGQLFTPTRDGLNSQLVRLLQEAGLQNVQTHAHRLSLDAGTTQGEHFAEDTRLAFAALVPFLRKWGQVPDDYEELYQQMLHEMQQPGFVATWNLLTVWGTNHR